MEMYTLIIEMDSILFMNKKQNRIKIKRMKKYKSENIYILNEYF